MTYGPGRSSGHHREPCAAPAAPGAGVVPGPHAYDVPAGAEGRASDRDGDAGAALRWADRLAPDDALLAVDRAADDDLVAGEPGPGATGELTLPLMPMPQAEIDAVLEDGWTAEPATFPVVERGLGQRDDENPTEEVTR